MRTTSRNQMEVAHAWAHQDPEFPLGLRAANLFYTGRTIYSYGHHFPIATIVHHKGKTSILFTTESYSNTTAKHMHYVRRAIPINVLVFPVNLKSGKFRVSEVSDQKEALDDMLRTVAERIAKAKRSRVYGPLHLNEARKMFETAEQFVKFFGLRKRLGTFDDLAGGKLVSQVAETFKKNRALHKEEEKRRQARIAQHEEDERIRRAAQREHDLARFERWKAGEDIQCPRSFYQDANGSAYLRRVNNRVVMTIPQFPPNWVIETSQGANVPEHHARRAYRFIKLCRMTGRSFEKNGRSVRVGIYEFLSIDTEGNCRIGCHTISWQRIEELAQSIGWSNDPGTSEALEVSQAVAH